MIKKKDESIEEGNTHIVTLKEENKSLTHDADSAVELRREFESVSSRLETCTEKITELGMWS